jgi:hypothetical protein
MRPVTDFYQHPENRLRARLFSVLRNRSGCPHKQKRPRGTQPRGLVLTLTAAYLSDRPFERNIYFPSPGGIFGESTLDILSRA